MEIEISLLKILYKFFLQPRDIQTINKTYKL